MLPVTPGGPEPSEEEGFTPVVNKHHSSAPDKGCRVPHRNIAPSDHYPLTHGVEVPSCNVPASRTHKVSSARIASTNTSKVAQAPTDYLLQGQGDRVEELE